MRALLGLLARPGWAEAGLLAVHIGGYLTAVFVALSPAQAVAFPVVQRGPSGAYLGSSFAPNHKGMPVVGKDEKLDSCAARSSPHATSTAACSPISPLAGSTTR